MKQIYLALFTLLVLSCSAPPLADTRPDAASNDVTEIPVDDGSHLEGPDSDYICSVENGVVRDSREYSMFGVPEPEGEVGPFTAADLYDELESGLPDGAFLNRATASGELGARVGSKELYARSGQDVHLYFGYVNERDTHPGTKMRSTVFVNYSHVQATYKNLSRDRTEVERESEGKTFQFTVDDDVELLDIIIPAEAFDRAGQYDIAVVSEAVGENPAEYGGASEIFRLYHEGFEKPDHPCLVQGQLVERSPLEEEMLQWHELRSFGFTVYPTSATTMLEILEDVVVDPGETIEFRHFVGPSFNGVYPTAFVAIPLIGGKAAGEPIYGTTPPALTSEESRMVAHRGSLEITAPTEPGTYEFEIMAWAEPFLAPGDQPAPGIGVPEGERRSAIMPSSREATIVVRPQP